MKKRIKDAIARLDDICYDLEDTFDCGTGDPGIIGEMVMEMSPQDHIMMFERMQDYIMKMRGEIEILFVGTDERELGEEDFPDNEETLCDRCNKRLSRKERTR